MTVRPQLRVALSSVVRVSLLGSHSWKHYERAREFTKSTDARASPLHFRSLQRSGCTQDCTVRLREPREARIKPVRYQTVDNACPILILDSHEVEVVVLVPAYRILETNK